MTAQKFKDLSRKKEFNDFSRTSPKIQGLFKTVRALCNFVTAIIEIFKREVKLILNSLSFVNIVLKLSSCYSMVCRSSHFSFEKVRGRGGEGRGGEGALI